MGGKKKTNSGDQAQILFGIQQQTIESYQLNEKATSYRFF